MHPCRHIVWPRARSRSYTPLKQGDTVSFIVNAQAHGMLVVHAMRVETADFAARSASRPAILQSQLFGPGEVTALFDT